MNVSHLQQDDYRKEIMQRMIVTLVFMIIISLLAKARRSEYDYHYLIFL